MFLYRGNWLAEYVFADRMNEKNQTFLQRATQRRSSCSAAKGKQDPPWPQPANRAFWTVKIEGLPSAVTRINVSIALRGGVQGFES